MTDIARLVADLSNLPGAPGREDAVRSHLGAVAAVLGTPVEMEVDALGNLLLHRPGPGRRLLLLAAMDEPALVVTHVDPDGWVWVGPAGTPDLERLGRRVRFADGTRAVLARRPPGEGHGRWYLDAGGAAPPTAVGAMAVADLNAEILPGGALAGKALGARGACAALLAALEHAHPGADLHAAFVSCALLDHRTVPSLVRRADPEMVVSVSGVAATDTPGATGADVRLGGGAVLVVSDRGLVASLAALDALAAAADRAGVRPQVAVADPGTTAAGPALRAGGGAPAGAIGFPLRHAGSPAEVCLPRDIEACAAVLAALPAVP